MNDINKFRVTGTKLSYENVTDRSVNNWRGRQFEHYCYFYQILHMLEAEGFMMLKDPEVSRQFKLISKNYWYGKRGELEFTARKYPNGFEIEFFQNVIFDNPNGGRYDFDKLAKMPHLIRLQYMVYMRKIIEKLKTLTEVKETTVPRAKNAVDKIKIDLVYNWRLFSDMNFDLTTMNHEPESYYGKDRDGKIIHNGDLKYFRQRRNGYISRGRVYYRANMQWWAVINEREAVIVNNSDLFDDFPSGEPARMAPDRTPEDFKKLQQKRERRKAAAVKLIEELERRGVRISQKVKRECIKEYARSEL